MTQVTINLHIWKTMTIHPRNAALAANSMAQNTRLAGRRLFSVATMLKIMHIHVFILFAKDVIGRCITNMIRNVKLPVAAANGSYNVTYCCIACTL